jgi:hypothetical protein
MLLLLLGLYSFGVSPLQSRSSTITSIAPIAWLNHHANSYVSLLENVQVLTI